MYVLLFYCITAVLQAVSGKYTPICQPKSSSSASPKLPTFPSAFSTSVQVNIVNKNYTALYRESYDLQANKGSVGRTRDGKAHRYIYDYNLNEKIFIDTNAKNCTVSSINGSRLNFFGNNNSHIESAAQLFRFAEQFHEEYMGVEYVRGIRCNHWRSCITRQNVSSYYLDYYFSVPDWKTTWHNSTLVRSTINGTRASRTPGGADHEFYHVYDFYNFRPGPPESSNFQLPDGYYCAGLKGENKTVPKVPSVFSMEFERVWSNNSKYNVTTWKEVYDFEKKLVLMNHPNWYHVNAGPLVQIYDFSTGFLYNISTGKSGPVCKVVILTKKTDSWFGASDGHHHLRLKTTQELFNTPQRNGSTPLVYKGSASVRGISTDIWVGKSSGVNRRTNQSYEFVLEWYFSKPNWRFRAGSQNDEHQVPVRIDFYSQRGHSEMNLFNFDAEAAEATAFDIKPCFKWEEQRYIQFALNGKYDEYRGSRPFLLKLTKAISTAANVSIIRVNGIRLLDSRGGMVVTFILLNKTKPEGGSVEVTVYPEKDLLAALDALKNSVQSGKFNVDFQKEKIYAAKSSFFVGFRTSTPGPSGGSTANPSDKPNPGGKSKIKTKGVSSGAAAGIAFLMLAVGICGGLLIAHVIMKRRGTSLFSYQRQE